MQRKSQEPREKLYEELVIDVKSVVKVTKGGRRRRYSATVVVGDRKGKVGLGIGKANEVPDAIKKAIEDAKKNLITIPIVGTTIPHTATGNFGAGSVLIRPATEGTGVIAGGPIRAVLELAGVNDILTKCLGSRTPINMVRATVAALKSLKTVEDVAKLRGLTREEVRA